nr:GNAT family N-acetyltransferase [FCB group bacterium]
YKENNTFIGRCGLLPWTVEGQYEVEVAFLISKTRQGQGLGTEAAWALMNYGFDKLKLSRLVCLIEKENAASIKVAEKIGMSFEKESRDETGPFLLYSIQNKAQ